MKKAYSYVEIKLEKSFETIGKIYFVWLQGESDAIFETSKAEYKEKYENLFPATEYLYNKLKNCQWKEETEYQITEIYSSEAENLNCLLQDDEKIEITLITCENASTTRLVVKAEEV